MNVDDIPSIVHHISVGTDNLEAAGAFYDAVLATVSGKRVFEFPGAIAYGKQFPEFWVQNPVDGRPAGTANGVHVAFIAGSEEAVDAFHEAALAAGGTSDGAPGPRPEYGPDYYGAFVRDLDGHKIEAAVLTAEGAEH